MAMGPRYPAPRSSAIMPGEPTLGSTLCSSTAVSALSRKTSAVHMITGGWVPVANPARRARSTSLPLTASIHSPAARTSASTFHDAFAFIA